MAFLHWFSRYHPRYPRVLVYMLQASEYGIRDYVAWYRRTKDFIHVERRKQLVKTPKAIILLVFCWGMVAVLVALDIGVLWIDVGPVKYAAFLLILLLSPFIIAFEIILPLVCIKIVQWPIECIVMYRARQALKAHRATKIGIAGSFGKTTMREILKTVLSEGKKTAAPPESHNTPLGISRFVKTLKGDEDILIFELGEYYPGDIRALCRLIQPDIGVITGINEAHLQKFKTLERTAKTIYELADYLGNKPVYVNGENELAREYSRPGQILYGRERVEHVRKPSFVAKSQDFEREAPAESEAYRGIRRGRAVGLRSQNPAIAAEYGVSEHALYDWRIENPKSDLTGTSFTLVKNNTRLELSSRLLGLHHLGPLAAAADIAVRLGLSPEQIKSGIAKTTPFTHRLQATTDQAGVITLDDSYNGNPDGVAAGIDFLASLAGHRRWYVTPGLVEMGASAEAVHREIGKRLAEAKIEKIVLIKNSVTPYIAKGLNENGYRGEVIWFEDALTALAALPHFTVPGDVVLLQNDWPDQYQ